MNVKAGLPGLLISRCCHIYVSDYVDSQWPRGSYMNNAESIDLTDSASLYSVKCARP